MRESCSCIQKATWLLLKDEWFINNEVEKEFSKYFLEKKRLKNVLKLKS